MNSVLKLVQGDAAPPPHSAAGEIVPDLGSAPGLDAAAVGTAHLSHCPRCGELNGRSAETCWSCEADLHAALPPGASLLREAPAAAGPAASSTDTTMPDYQTWHDLGLDMSAVSAAIDAATAGIPHASTPAGRPLPVLTHAVRLGPAAAAYPEYAPAVARARPRPMPLGLIAAGAGTAIALLSVGVYLYLGSAEPEARTPVPAALRAPPPAALLNGGLAVPESGDGLSRADAALRAAELLAGPLPALSPTEPAAPEAHAIGTDRARPTRRGNSRDTARSSAPAGPAAARQSAPDGTPCTPTVVALGLCGGTSHPTPKE